MSFADYFELSMVMEDLLYLVFNARQITVNAPYLVESSIVGLFCWVREMDLDVAKM